MAVASLVTIKGEAVTSPKGKALWCKVAEPERTYNPKGTYSTDIVCDPNEPAVQLFINKLQDLVDKAFEEVSGKLKPAQLKTLTKKDVFKEDTDAEGEPTGLIRFKFQLKDVDDKEAGRNKIKVYDKVPKEVKDIPLVGNGSVIKCAGYARPYYMANGNYVGVSLSWSSMQIIDLIEYGGSAFESEEGAYEASPNTSSFDSEDEDY